MISLLWMCGRIPEICAAAMNWWYASDPQYWHTQEKHRFSQKCFFFANISKQILKYFFPGFLLSVTCIIGTQGKPWKVFLILCKYIQANTGHGKLFRRWAVLFCYAAEIRISKYWIPYKNDHRHCTKEWILNKIIVNIIRDIVFDWLFNSSWQRIMFFLTSEFYISDVFHKISPKPISLEIRYPLRAIVVSLKPGLSAQKP